MPTIRVMPHATLCPKGTEFAVEPGENLCESLLRHDVSIEHACELSRACTTCHVIIRQGFDSLEPSDEEEDDLLDKAWGLSPHSRLSCQVHVADQDLSVEIPRYTINHARET